MNNFDQKLNELYFNNVTGSDILEEGVLDNIKKWAAIAAVGVPVLIGMFKMGGVIHDNLLKDPDTLPKPDLWSIVDDLRDMAQDANLPPIDPATAPPDPATYRDPNPEVMDPGPRNARPSVRPPATFEDYKQRISREEGIRDRVYKDSKGLLTVGIGHLITKDDTQTFPLLFGPDFDFKGLLRGKVRLTQDQIDSLFEHDLAGKMNTVRRHVTVFNDLPGPVQVAVFDGFFRGDLSGSPKTLGHMNAGRWDQAASEYLDNDEYRASKAQGTRHGVWQRMERNAKQFKYHANMLKRLKELDK